MGDAKRRARLDPDFGRAEVYTLHLYWPFSHDYLFGLSFTAAWSGSWEQTNKRSQALTALVFAYLHQSPWEAEKLRQLSIQLAAKLGPQSLVLLKQEKPNFPSRFWGRVEFPESAEGDGYLCSTPGGEVYPGDIDSSGTTTVVNALDPEMLKLAS